MVTFAPQYKNICIVSILAFIAFVNANPSGKKEVPGHVRPGTSGKK
jgi:hypothetical protein